MNHKKLAGLWGFLTLLLALALWTASLGRVTLYGPSSEVLESLCRGRDLIEWTHPFTLGSMLSRLPFDPLLTLSLFQASCLVVSFLGLWWVLYKVWQNPMSPTLACGLLYFGPHSLWLVAESPEQHLTVALKALAFACLVSGKVPLLCGAVILLACVVPANALSFLLALGCLAYKRQEAYGPWVCTVSVVGAGSLFLMSLGDFVLDPTLGGIGLWALWPLGSLLLSKEIREARWELYLTLLAAAAISGTEEMASALCLGDLALIMLKKPSVLSPTAPHRWSFSIYRMTLLASLAVLVAAVLPGEQYLNRNILIHAQKQNVGLPNLLAPFTLEAHAAAVSEEPWRERVPFPGMSKSDMDLLSKIDTPFRVLTQGQVSEDRRLSLVYALLTEQALVGWENSTQLSASSLICKQLNKNVVVGKEVILFRNEERSRLEEGPESPNSLDTLAEVDFRSLVNVPYREQFVSSKKGSGYLLQTLQSTETLLFQESQALVVFPAARQVYTLASLKNPQNQREQRIASSNLELTLLDAEEVFPSRSLIPLKFMLFNRGLTPVSTQMIESMSLGLRGITSFGAFKQASPSVHILFPGEGVEITLYLSTPEVEGDFQLQASYQSLGGSTHSFELTGPQSISTWRRLPPVGTWIEEPMQP